MPDDRTRFEPYTRAVLDLLGKNKATRLVLVGADGYRLPRFHGEELCPLPKLSDTVQITYEALMTVLGAAHDDLQDYLHYVQNVNNMDFELVVNLSCRSHCMFG